MLLVHTVYSETCLIRHLNNPVNSLLQPVKESPTVCEITACQRTFSRQKCFLSGHTDICMDKMSGQSLNQKLLEIDNHIHNYKSFSTMSRQFYPCPWKLCHALTVCLPIFQKLFCTLPQMITRQNSYNTQVYYGHLPNARYGRLNYFHCIEQSYI